MLFLFDTSRRITVSPCLVLTSVEQDGLRNDRDKTRWIKML